MIVAGFGFRAAATMESLADALARTGAVPEAVATLTDKSATLAALADQLALPLHSVSAEAARKQTTLTTSDASQLTRQIPSVAEACALAAAGPGAKLLAPRVVSGDRMATCAIAIGGHS